MTFQRSGAIILTLLLMVGDVAAGSTVPAVLGVVVVASRAHLSSGDISVGTTVYDGDTLSTDSGGLLRVRSGAALLYIEEESAVILRNSAGNSAEGAEANVGRGKIIFSAARATAMHIVALGAQVAPAADAPTVAEVGITAPKELRILARRGSLEFSYGEASEVIPEGEICLVELDADDNQAVNVKDVKKHRHKRFVVIAIATGVAMGAGAAYWATHSGGGAGAGTASTPISPDKP